MKITKRILVVVLLLITMIVIGGIAKYNIELNRYIAKENTTRPKRPSISLPERTEVHIVGTVHFETDSIKRPDLYSYVDSIGPDVILYEGDASTVHRIAKKRDYFFQLVAAFGNQSEMEKAIVHKYMARNAHCILLPYEWKLRYKYHRKHRLSKMSKKLINAVIRMYRHGQLTDDQSNTIKKFLELNKVLVAIDNNATIDEINSPVTDSILERRQEYIYEHIPEIALDRKELSEYLDFVPIHMYYWDTRNKAMAQNILKQIKLNPNKVIVVLNGFYHRYYLIRELKKYERALNFSVM